jgi:cyclopropane fatty-acyl-phospholipid synthase-like methyltransferase
VSDPKEIVEQGYDAIAERYAEWQPTIKGSPTVQYLERLLAKLPSGAEVLELGCGNGEPAARIMAENNRYTGVDLSREQLRRARDLVRVGNFLHADYTALELPNESFDAVVALYTFGHLPREELPAIFDSVALWLRPGGYLLATTGRRDVPGQVQDDWLGAPMFFAAYDVETNLRLLADSGFEVLKHEVVEQDEGEEGVAAFLWILARKPPGRAGGLRSGRE